MSKVIEFNRKSAYTKKVKESKPSTAGNESYFFSVEGIRLDFGGAFVRDILTKLEEKREFISSLVGKILDSDLNKLKNIEKQEFDDELIAELEMAVIKTAEVYKEILTELKTPEDFDRIFSTKSHKLVLTVEILTIVMCLSYTEFDVRRMEKDNWLAIGGTIGEFMSILEEKTSIYNRF